MSMRIGLFGGTFDPVHYGHLRLAEEAREHVGLERVYFVPAHLSPFRTSEKHAEGHHRLQMLHLATQDNPAFGVSEIEIERGGVSYTIDTLNAFRTQYAHAEFYLIMGLDTLAGFAHWYQVEAILQVCQLLVGIRPTHDWHATLASLPEWVRPNLQAVPMTPLGISASDPRRRCAQGRSLRYLMPPDVIEYIHQHQLYTEPR